MELEKRKQLLLDVAEFNDKKYSIIKKMTELEINGNTGKEFEDLIDSYDVVTWYLNKKLSEADIIDKNELCNALMLSSGEKLYVETFMDMIKNFDGMLTVRRTINDFDGQMVSFFNYDTETEEEIHSYAFDKIMKKFNSIADKKINCDMINSYLVHDFLNMMLSIIIKESKEEKVAGLSTILTELKYNLIYLSRDLEAEALKNRFKFTDKIDLIDEKTITKIGISKNEYIDVLNYVFGGMLEDSIYDAVNRVNDNKLPTLEYTDHLLIKTVANLVTDKRMCDTLILEPNDEMEPNIRKATILINYDLLEAKNVDTYDRKKLVK